MTNRPSAGRPASLARRVTTLVGMIIALCFVTLGWLVPKFVAHHFTEQDAEELRVVAASVGGALAGAHPETDDIEVVRRLSGAVAGHHGVFFAVYDPKGRLVYETAGADLTPIASTVAPVETITTERLSEWRDAQHGYRGAVLHIPGAAVPYTVVVAAATDFHRKFIVGFRNALWAMLIAVGLLMILATWFAVQRGHAPLHRVSGIIRSITSDDLSTRLRAEDVPIELSELVASFNDMLGRMADVFQRLSNFSADIAHELRTPITNLTTQTQVALSRARGVEEYREVLYSSLEEYDRMASMIGDMLWLAKTDSGLVKPAFVELDLAAEITTVFEYFEVLAEDGGVALRLQGQCQRVRGDREMLRRAFGNLLSNAIRHAPRGEMVTVRLSSSADRATVVVENPGSTIPPEHLPRVFDRFYRVDASRQRRGEGAGLGLAIVKSIVAMHGGCVSARSENGLCAFTVELPTSVAAVADGDVAGRQDRTLQPSALQ